MNNFWKYCAFYIITFAPWRPQEGGMSRRSPPPPPGNDKTIRFFSPCEVPLFSFFFLGGGPCFSFWSRFSPCGEGGGGSLCVEIFMLIPICKNFYSAHALNAKVVVSALGKLREIARLTRYPIC